MHAPGSLFDNKEFKIAPVLHFIILEIGFFLCYGKTQKFILRTKLNGKQLYLCFFKTLLQILIIKKRIFVSVKKSIETKVQRFT